MSQDNRAAVEAANKQATEKITRMKLITPLQRKDFTVKNNSHAKLK